jgi:hypothetical protein
MDSYLSSNDYRQPVYCGESANANTIVAVARQLQSSCTETCGFLGVQLYTLLQVETPQLFSRSIDFGITLVAVPW